MKSEYGKKSVSTGRKERERSAQTEDTEVDFEGSMASGQTYAIGDVVQYYFLKVQ